MFYHLNYFPMYFFYWQELKFRGLYSLCHWIMSLCLVYYYKEAIISFSAPISYFIVTNLFEAVWASMQFCLWFSLILCFPLICLQIYIFLRPGYYCYEIKFANRFLILAFFFSLIGFCGFIWIFPKIWSTIIITSLDEKGFISVYLETNLQTYVVFLGNCLYFLFCSSFFFIGVSVTCHRRIPYFFMTLFACFISPPDLFSFFTLLFCWIFCYELVLFIISIYRIYTGRQLKLKSRPIVQASHAKDSGRKTFQPRPIS
jgi:sec-independent protein translocase protein TatC